MRDYFIAVDDNNETLTHYGVVGMRWHHRKAADYKERAERHAIASATSWTALGRKYSKSKADKYNAKAKAHLDKNRANIKAGKYDAVKGKKYTKITGKNLLAATLRNSTKDTLKSMAMVPITMPIYSGAAGAYEGLRRGGFNKQGVNAAKRYAKENFKGTLDAELKFAKAASYKVRKKRDAKRSRNAYANTYGLPQFTNRQRNSTNRGRNFIDI